MALEELMIPSHWDVRSVPDSPWKPQLRTFPNVPDSL